MKAETIHNFISSLHGESEYAKMLHLSIAEIDDQQKSLLHDSLKKLEKMHDASEIIKDMV